MQYLGTACEWGEYVRMMQELGLGIPTPWTELDLPQSDNIRISQTGSVVRVSENPVELDPMNFGVPANQPKRGSIFNCCSERRNFANSRRYAVLQLAARLARGIPTPVRIIPLKTRFSCFANNEQFATNSSGGESVRATTFEYVAVWCR